MMVEVLCATLSGATFGPNVRRWGSTDRIADLGQCFIAINPQMFAAGFGERLDSLVAGQRGLEARDPAKPVLVAGDPERQHIDKCARLGGIPYPKPVVDHMVSRLRASTMLTRSGRPRSSLPQ